MKQRSPPSDLPRAQRLTERVLTTLERFLRVEATSGIVLLVAAAVALIWANSPWAGSYQAVWHAPLGFGVGGHGFSRSLHFWINDGLMAIFFLLIGMEIRREVHEGALSQVKQALLPIAAALGGVIVPALIYLGLNHGSVRQQGWAVPTATDIAFAIGVLALLGRSIPGHVRVFLLTLAIIDDVVAVLIIAVFYAGGLDYVGFVIAGSGVMMVWLLQRMGIGHAYAYVVPGAIVWIGLMLGGIHPTLAGVVLGLMTPVHLKPMRERPLDTVSRITDELTARAPDESHQSAHLTDPLRELRRAQREMLPPVVRVQSALHPWVSYGIMPLFALANAGIALGGIDLSAGASRWIVFSVILALVAGKPLGVMVTSWTLVRLGVCRLPAGMTWGGVWLVGLLAGIGFTMSIFIAMLAFSDEHLLEAAKLGVLVGSLMAGVLGAAWGVVYVRGLRADEAADAADR